MAPGAPRDRQDAGLPGGPAAGARREDEMADVKPGDKVHYIAGKFSVLNMFFVQFVRFFLRDLAIFVHGFLNRLFVTHADLLFLHSFGFLLLIT